MVIFYLKFELIFSISFLILIGVHNGQQHISNNALDANGIMEYVSVSHSPSMRSISADVSRYHNHNSSNQNYHLLNKSQDLVSIHSANSTSLVSGLNSSNLVNTNLSSSNVSNVKSSQQQQATQNNQHISNRKLSRILYEIGSILSFVGLGKDYKHQQQQMTAPQTPSSLHSNSVLLTSQPNTPKPSSKHHHARRSQDQKKQTINSGQTEHSTSSSVSGFIKSHAKSMLSSATNPLRETPQHHQQQHLAGYAANVGSGAHELIGSSHLHQHQSSPSHSLTRLAGGNMLASNNSNATLNTATTKASRFKSLSSTSGSHMAAASHYHKSFEDRDEEIVSKRLSPSSAARSAASALVAQSAAAQAASTSSLLSVDMPIASSSNTRHRDNNLLSPRTTIVRQESLNPPPPSSNGLYVNNNTQIMRSMQKKYSKSIDCTPHHLNLNVTTAGTAQMYLDPHLQPIMNQSNTNHTMSSSNSGISYSGSSYINNSNSQLVNSSHTHANQNNQSSMSSISSISQSNSIYGANASTNYNTTSGADVNTMTNSSPLVPRRADYEPIVRITTIQRQNRIYEQPSPTISGLDENFSYSPNSTSKYNTSNVSKTHNVTNNQAISSPNLPNRPITLDLKQPFNDSSNDIIELMGSGQIVSINKTKSPSPTLDSVIQTESNNNKNQISPPSNLIQVSSPGATASKVSGGNGSHRQQLQMNMRDTSPFSSLSSSSAAASSVPSSLSPMGTSPRLVHKPISNHSNNNHHIHSHSHHQSQC